MSDQTHDWYGPAVACGLGALGMLLDLVITRSIPGTPEWPNVACSAVSLTLLALMLSGRRSPRFVAAAFIANNLAMATAFWISDSYFAQTVQHWTPFRPHQLGILTTALLAPPTMWAGVVGIATFVVGAVGHYFLFDPATRAQLPAGSHTVVIAYGMTGLVLFVYRLRHTAAVRARTRAESEKAALRRLARSFLALRDLANTPLQTLEVGVGLLRDRDGNGNGGVDGVDRAEVIDRMRRALERLRESHRLLAGLDAHVPWESTGESIDSIEILRDSGKPLKH